MEVPYVKLPNGSHYDFKGVYKLDYYTVDFTDEEVATGMRKPLPVSIGIRFKLCHSCSETHA